MKPSLLEKLEKIALRQTEINTLLASTKISNNPQEIKKLSIELRQIRPIVDSYHKYQQILADIDTANDILSTDDTDLKEMAKEELQLAKVEKTTLVLDLQKQLLPKDENDSRNVILEIRAGTGGDEASIFSGDLLKMYLRFAEKKGWQSKMLSSNASEHGGFKEVIVQISGQNVYGKLKFESGAHRVQRVPQTESQGRVHTSACTVAVMPEVSNIEEVNINMNDLRIDTFRASGAGGQHVNKTDSAVRITHTPTGTVVECQDGRSQHKNKAQALSILASRILDTKQREQHQAQAQNRKQLIGSGDRSERIRTYNFPQGRLTDHRINLTLYRLLDVLEGNLEEVIEALIIEQQTQLLNALNH